MLITPKIIVFYEGINTVPENIKGAARIRNSFLLTQIRNWYIKKRGMENIRKYNGEGYRCDLEKFIQNCEDLNTTLILVTFSIPFTENAKEDILKYWDVMQNGHSSTYAEAVLVRKHNEILIELAKKYNITIVYSRPVLNNKPEYFIDSVHLAQEGCQKLAELIADAILKDVN